MTTFQKYLDLKYPSQEDREKVTEIILENIMQERENEGEVELLEGGGELVLGNFKNLERVEINLQLLKSSLNKLNVESLKNLKVITWIEAEGESEEEKKLWEELGLENNFNKKSTIKEIKKILAVFSKDTSKKISVEFSTEKKPLEALKDNKSFIENKDEKHLIYLQLENKTKSGAFSPSLVFWNLAWELASLKHPKYAEEPLFWSCFNEELKKIEKNLSPRFKTKMISFFEPTNFPSEHLEMKELLVMYFPTDEEVNETSNIKNNVSSQTVNSIWKLLGDKLPELVDKKLSENINDEEKKQLFFKLTIEKGVNDYIIQVQYHAKNPLQGEIKELVNTTLLKSELEKARKENKELPKQEEFEKLVKKNSLLEECLKDHLDESSFSKIKNELDNL